MKLLYKYSNNVINLQFYLFGTWCCDAFNICMPSVNVGSKQQLGVQVQIPLHVDTPYHMSLSCSGVIYDLASTLLLNADMMTDEVKVK